MPRDNRCMYMAHVCFVATVVENRGVLSLGVLKYVVCLCMGSDVRDVVFSVCIVMRGAVGARVWEV